MTECDTGGGSSRAVLCSLHSTQNYLETFAKYPPIHTITNPQSPHGVHLLNSSILVDFTHTSHYLQTKNSSGMLCEGRSTTYANAMWTLWIGDKTYKRVLSYSAWSVNHKKLKV